MTSEFALNEDKQLVLTIDVTEGVRRALAMPGPAPHILICGGLHFAGEVLAMSPETWPT